MNVYHWTTRENAEKILKEGLKKLSFVCKNPDVWHGDVCLEISGMTDWEDDDETSWQALTADYVPPKRIRIWKK